MSCDAFVFEYVCVVSPSMDTRRSGLPLSDSFTSQMLWLSADMRAREMPSVDSLDAAVYHQTTSPSVSKMTGTRELVPIQNEVMKNPLGTAAAFFTEKLVIGVELIFAPVVTVWSSLVYVVAPLLATIRKWYVFAGFMPSSRVR